MMEMSFPSGGNGRENSGMPHHAPFCVKLFGGIQIEIAGEEIPLISQKARALFAYLLLSQGRSISRQQIVGLLWSEVPEQRARASLRQDARTLRSALDKHNFEGLTTNRSDLTVDPSTIESDVISVLDYLDSGRVHPILLENERITDTLLSGYDDIDPSFRNWLRVQRENLSQRIIRTLNGMVEEGARNSSGNGKDAAEALLQLDPTNETACRYLIEYYARQGDTATALSIYSRLWSLLDTEFDTEPSQRTQELIVSVKLGELDKPSTGNNTVERALDGPGVPGNGAAAGNTISLVVGAIDMEGVLEDNHHICVGFRAELIAMLVRFREWTIVDKSTSGVETQANIPGATGYELDGRIIQEGSGIYLFCQLKDQITGAMIWGDRFELGLENYFSTKQEVVRKVTFSLNVHISQERLQRFAGQPDVSLDIYDRWLRGQAYFLQWSPETRVRATNIFNSIIEEAPNFARAYSSLVGLHNSDHFVFPGVYRTEETAQKALVLSRKAVELDPLDSRSHVPRQHS